MGQHPLGHLGISPAIRRGLRLGPRCGLLLGLLLTAAASWADTYRWVDDHGVVHYGDSIPPRYSGGAHEELDAQGRVTRRVESAAVTEQQRQQREAEAARANAMRRALTEQARHDNALLSTYANVDEIDRARDRMLSTEMVMVDSLMGQLKQAASQEDIQRLDDAIAMHYKNMENIRMQFAADKARYLQLTAKPR